MSINLTAYVLFALTRFLSRGLESDIERLNCQASPPGYLIASSVKIAKST
jgi:hypothetical protein